MIETLQLVGTLLLLSATIPGILIAPVYHYVSEGLWRRSMAGRAIMRLGLTFVVTLSFATILVIFTPPEEVRAVLRIISYGTISVALWGLLAVMIKAKRRPEALAPTYDQKETTR